RGVTLEGHGDDRAGLVVRALARLDLVLTDLAVRDVTHLLLDALEEQAARLILPQAGDTGQLDLLLLLEQLDLRPLRLERRFLVDELLLAAGQRRGLGGLVRRLL